MAACRLDRLRHGPSLSDDLEARAPIQQGDQSLADDLVIVDDEEAQGADGNWLGHGSLPFLDPGEGQSGQGR